MRERTRFQYRWDQPGKAFFFSSRRRLTSSLRDWSSDVCSSDLTVLHTTEAIEDIKPLIKAMELKPGRKDRKNEPLYYQVKNHAAYAEGLSRLALGVPAFLRNGPVRPEEAAKAQPLMFRLHDKN